MKLPIELSVTKLITSLEVDSGELHFLAEVEHPLLGTQQLNIGYEGYEALRSQVATQSDGGGESPEPPPEPPETARALDVAPQIFNRLASPPAPADSDSGDGSMFPE